MKIASYRITIGNATDTGKVREHNEDYMAHFDTPIGYVVIVCDGMGGHAAGEVASQTAIEAIKHYLVNGEINKTEPRTKIQSAIEFANFKLREMVQQNSELKGMGTTCVMALIKDTEMYAAHAGDSRLFLLRGKEINQITKDHSAVQNLIDAEVLTEEEAEQSDKKNQITKAIGIFEKVEPTISEAIPLMYNDKILLCSDGLTGHLDKKSIYEIIKGKADVQEAALKLIEKANDKGGVDNITVQLIHYTGKSSKQIKKRPLVKKLVISIVLAIAIVMGIYGYNKIFNSVKENKQINKETIAKPSKEIKNESKSEEVKRPDNNKSTTKPKGKKIIKGNKSSALKNDTNSNEKNKINNKETTNKEDSAYKKIEH